MTLPSPNEAIARLSTIHPPEKVDRELVLREGLWQFAQSAWQDVEADELVPSWHMEEICAHLEAVSRGECKRLIITVPPGCTKSTLVSVLWPAWDWLSHPTRKWMFATFDAELMRRDANRARQLVSSPWFAARFGDLVQINSTGKVQDTQSIYNTDKGGRRVSVTVAGKATGWHAEIQVVDDPIKAKDVMGSPDVTKAALERAWTWWRATMASRRSNPKKFARVIIMQRLHEDDLVGRLMREDREVGEWTHLNLPMRAELATRCRTKWGGDRRTVEGELLVPGRFDEKVVAEMEREMGSQVASAQLQQRPAPASGNVFKREWFRKRWVPMPVGKPLKPLEEHQVYLPTGLQQLQSWDCTFKDKAGSDYVAGHVWGFKGATCYLLDRIHDRMGLPETCACLVALMRRHPKAFGKLIEDKANGPAVEQTLRGKVPGIIMVEPEGGKVARANAVAPIAEAANIILPDPSVFPWVDEVLEEIVAFPFARHDDDVDAMTQAISYIVARGFARYMDAMRNVAAGKVKFNGVG